MKHQFLEPTVELHQSPDLVDPFLPKVDPRALGRYLFDADVRLLRFEYLQEFLGDPKQKERKHLEMDFLGLVELRKGGRKFKDLRGCLFWLKLVNGRDQKQTVDGVSEVLGQHSGGWKFLFCQRKC